MKKKHSVTLLIITLLLTVFAPGRASALDLIVEHNASGANHYSTIQAALEYITSNTGTTTAFKIIVEPSSEPYNGPITITSSHNNVPIEGRETARTIISGTGTGTLITATNVSNLVIRRLTIRNAGVGILVSGTSIVEIKNNIFQVGASGTAVQISGATGVSIVNNTFYQNGVAIARDTDSGVITNNIFYNSANTIQISQPGSIGATTITYNMFYPGLNGTSGTSAIPNVTVPELTDPDPYFVAPQNGDFHIQYKTPTASAAVNQGSPSINDNTIDNTRSDMGAYGGPDADPTPFQLAKPSVTPSGTAATVSWTANTSYLIADPADPGTYNIFYNLSGGPTSTVNILATAPTSTVITGLTAASTPPGTPVLNVPGYADGRLLLTWSPVSDATGYIVHYLDSVTGIENSVDVQNTVMYVLSGLVNGREYGITVSAYKQSIYSFSMTVKDNTVGAHESALSPAETITVGTPVEGLRSSPTQTAFPERIVPNPDLPNSGCFIATAAYGSYSAPEVRILRRFRDAYLLDNAPGRAFVAWYYRYGPRAAAFVNDHAWIKPLIRAALLPAVAGASFLLEMPIYMKMAVILIAGFLFLFAVRNLRKKTARSKGVAC